MSKLDDILNEPGSALANWNQHAKQQVKDLLLELIDVQLCEENCTDVRHAYHQGQAYLNPIDYAYATLCKDTG